MQPTKKEYSDIPGTIVFDADQARMGYGINNKSKVLAETLSSSPPRVRGLKTLQVGCILYRTL